MADVTPVLVLASGSPRRADLLARLGVVAEVRPADLDETPGHDEPAVDLVVRLAAAKARASAALGKGAAGDAPAARHTDAEVVLAADTVVVLDGRTLNKPRDRAEARAMLEALAGRSHEVITGVAVLREGVTRTTTVTTRVRFRALSGPEIAWYVATGEPDDKAGAYGLQGAGAVLIEGIDGSDTNVIGLPLAETVALLREVGVDLLVP